MADFSIDLLATGDGSWDKFRVDWERQCAEVGETFAEYAPDALSLLSGIVGGNILGVGGDNETRVGALWDSESERYYACCMLNLTRLPQTEGKTLRVRHLIVSPLLDYGVADVELYPDVIIGVLSNIVHISSTSMEAEHIRFHLRSPEDQSFFRLVGTSLGASDVFASVQTHGAWLYIEKAAGVSHPAAEEEK